MVSIRTVRLCATSNQSHLTQVSYSLSFHSIILKEGIFLSERAKIPIPPLSIQRATENRTP